MLKIIVLVIVSLTNSLLFCQTYIGKSKENSYDCIVRISKDSTINFIYSRDDNGIYGEHKGLLKRINDTLFHILAVMTVGQFYMKPYHNDTIYIHIDSSIAKELDVIEIEYSDRKTRTQLQGYDNFHNPITMLKIPINKTLFNTKKGKDYINITINKKNPISGIFLNFRIPYGSAADFTKNEIVDFDVIIKNKLLSTIGEPPLQTGHFQLENN